MNKLLFLMAFMLAVSINTAEAETYNADRITAARWAKAIATVTGIRKAISRCINDNAGVIVGLCDSTGVQTDTSTLGKYGILTTGIDDLNNGTTSGVRPNTQISVIYGTGAIQLAETTPGTLGGCTFQIVPTVVPGTGTITWTTQTSAFSSPAWDTTSCDKFVRGMVWHDTYNADTITRAKWAKAFASISGIRAAISRCINDNAGVIAGLCDYVDYYSGLGKYGISTTGLDDLNFGTTSGVRPNTQISVIAGTGAIQLAETIAGSLGGCTFQIVPTMAYGSGTIAWTTRVGYFMAPATAETDCYKFIRSGNSFYSWNDKYNADTITRAKWAKAVATIAGIRKAINRCINDNAGVIAGLCDSAGVATDANTLGKYGILTTGLADLNFGTTSGVMPETQVSIVPTTGAIQLTETMVGSLGGCTFQIVPTVVLGTGTITWTTHATAFAAPALAGTDCTKFVKGSIAY